MRILIFGGNGMLGHKLLQVLGREFTVYYTLRGDIARFRTHAFFDPQFAIENIDVRRESDLKRAIDIATPDVVINAAGIVKQRPDSKDVIETLLVNSILPHRLADYAREYGFRLINISTDCVFSGRKGNYNEADETDAADIYGRSKQLGEPMNTHCLTIRTSIIGRELYTSHGLVEWFLSRAGGQVNGYRNAIFSGFPTVVLADILKTLIVRHRELSGLYHISAEPISKFALLGLINDRFKLGCQIRPADLPVIDRSLDSTRFRIATGFQPQGWPEMINAMYLDAVKSGYELPKATAGEPD